MVKYDHNWWHLQFIHSGLKWEFIFLLLSNNLVPMLHISWQLSCHMTCATLWYGSIIVLHIGATWILPTYRLQAHKLVANRSLSSHLPPDPLWGWTNRLLQAHLMYHIDIVIAPYIPHGFIGFTPDWSVNRKLHPYCVNLCWILC